MDVSVYMITYFHEDYIAQALDSVLRQKTKYSFEIVVSDDGSTDGTMKIVNEYQNKYPDIIRAYHHEKNLGIPKNIYFARTHCKGKYIVALSGDDYWIDDEKIEKQAEFLKKNQEIVAVCNAMQLRYDNDSTPFDILPKSCERDRIFTLKDYEKGKTLYTHGLMMKNYFLTQDGRDYFARAQKISDKVDDAVDNVLLLKKGDVYVMDIVTDVYRVPRDKNTSNNYNSKYGRFEKIVNTIELYNNMYSEFSGEVYLKNKYENTFSVALLDAIITRKFNKLMQLYRTIPEEYRIPKVNGVLIHSVPKAVKFAFEYIVKRK